MKTLHITNSWHPKSGGIRTFYLAMLEAANQRGHEMRLVVPAEKTRVERVGQHGVVYHVEAPRAPFSPSYRILYPHRALLPGSAVHRILQQEQPDLVEVCDKFTMNYLGGLLRVKLLPGIRFRPVVVALSCERLDRTASIYLGNRGAIRALAQLYLRWAYFPLADHHIAVSRFVADELRDVSDGHKVDRGVWIGPMGVDVDTFSRAARQEGTRREVLSLVGGDDGTLVLVYAGRLAKEKNLELLFDAMEELLNRPWGERYRLLLVGDGDARQDLQRKAEARLPGLVHYVGHRSAPPQLANLLAACDVFVHPNPCEPYGIAPLEAMAAGVPLVVPNRGGVLSYATSENVWMAGATGPEFAAAISEVHDDGEMRARKVEAARRTAMANAWPAAAARYLDLYAELRARVTLERSGAGFEPAFFSTR